MPGDGNALVKYCFVFGSHWDERAKSKGETRR